MWAYLMKYDDERCMRLAREVGEGLTQEETVQLSMAISEAIQSFFECRQSDHSDAD